MFYFPAFALLGLFSDAVINMGTSYLQHLNS